MKFEREPFYSAPESSSGGSSPELARETSPVITPEALFSDNYSDYAYERRERWDKARRDGALTVIKACGDARLLLPDEKSVHVRSIATVGPVEPFIRLINHEGVQDIVVVAHYAGNTVEPRQVPKGCGGQDTLAVLRDEKADSEEERTGVLGFVEEHVHHPDVIRNAYQSAFLTSVHTDKPVLAVTQDHLDGTIHPIAAFWDSGRKAVAAVPLKYMLDEYYDPEIIYAEGVPVLNENDIPSNFAEFLDESKRQAIILHKKYRNYRTNQQTQNPSVVALNAGIRPYGVTQPETLRDPNIVFQLSVARDRLESTIHISDEVLDTTFDQAEYPIMHAIKHFGEPQKSFSNVTTVLVETPDIDQSERVARRLTERPWMKEWQNLPGKQIIITQKQAGIATQIEVLS